MSGVVDVSSAAVDKQPDAELMQRERGLVERKSKAAGEEPAPTLTSNGLVHLRTISSSALLRGNLDVGPSS